jgi:hypothetical protein
MLYLKPLKWSLLPTVLFYVCFSFYELSFTAPIEAFVQNKGLRLALLLTELFIYFLLLAIYHNRKQLIDLASND